MSIEYNSKLISKLYQENSEGEIIEVLDQMDEAGEDPYFLRPLYDKYKAKENSFISHYFLGNIAKFKSKDAVEIMRGIALDPKTNDKNFLWTLNYLAENSVYDEAIIGRVQQLLAIFDDNDGEYNLDSILSYLDKAKSLTDQGNILKEIFEKGKFSSRVRKKALHFLLKINPKEYLQYYFDNYDDFKKDEDAENIFADEITRWDKGIIPEFEQKIIKNGGSRAKEIIENHLRLNQEKDHKEEKKKEEEVVAKYANANLITEIYQLRENINNNTLSKWGFKLFLSSEILFKQNEIAQQRSTLIAYCNDLRSILKNVSPQCNYENLEEAKKVIIEIKDKEDLKRPLNQLQLYLYSQGLVVDKGLFGLRDLNHILNLVDHPEAEGEFFKSLGEIDLASMWNLQDWVKIHKKFLEIYKTALEKLHAIFVESIKLPK